MRAGFLLFGMIFSFSAHADCKSYGHTFKTGEKDCNGLVCKKDGSFSDGGATKMMCHYEDEQDQVNKDEDGDEDGDQD